MKMNGLPDGGSTSIARNSHVPICSSVPEKTCEPLGIWRASETSGTRVSVTSRPESATRFGSRTPRNCSARPGTVDRAAESRRNAAGDTTG
jgi:hypothetical protein